MPLRTADMCIPWPVADTPMAVSVQDARWIRGFGRVQTRAGRPPARATPANRDETGSGTRQREEREAFVARRDVVVLGSTGSIGTQALEIVRRNPDRFRVVGLTAGGSRPDLLEQQVAEFAPAFHGTGEDASVEAAALACDVVLNGISGALGPAAHGGRPRGGHHAGAGQQGVADHRRARW